MRITKEVQAGILVCLYLARAGQAKAFTLADELKISPRMMGQICFKLKKAGVLLSAKGPGGGYKLNGEVTLRSIFNALGPIELLDAKEIKAYGQGSPEHRALLHIAVSMLQQIRAVTNLSINSLMFALVNKEMDLLNKADEKGVRA